MTTFLKRVGIHVGRHGAFLSSAGLLLVLSPWSLLASEAGGGWELGALRELCKKYVDESAQPVTSEERQAWLNRLAREMGARLASSGLSSVPSEDLALLSVLVSRQARDLKIPAEQSEPAVRTVARAASGRMPQARQQAERHARKPSSGASNEQDASDDELKEQVGEEGFSDIGKGQEGFVQGVERLAGMPLTERMTITGDITSGFQGATVSNAPTLTSTFGRARVNFVTRAVETSPDNRFSHGYFFVQMVAAGGPFDASAVGGPSSFAPLNDVATDRSRFNEGTSRGNLYLAKAFYQQEMDLGSEDSILARVGVIDLSDLFDTNDFANNEARQFLNGSFVNSGGYKGAIIAPGFMGEYRRRVESEWLRRLVFRTGYAVSRTERAFTSPVWTGEVEVQTTFRGYEGKYRFGGTLGNVADVGGIHGVHFTFDQWISRKVGVYGRYATSNSGPGSRAIGPVRWSYSGGAQWRFVDEQERISAWGLGFSQSFGIETSQPLVSERALETYYRWQLTKNFSLTPDFQLVFGSGGSRDQGTHVVGSLRMNFGF